MDKKRPNVLITGANGVVGKILTKFFNGTWNLYTTDLKGPKKTNFYRADIADLKQVEEVFRKTGEIDIVIHLAADSRVNAGWDSVLKNNIIGTRNIYECARKYKVKKVVFASTNHVTGGYEGIPPKLHKKKHPPTITVHSPLRPDSYYASSKILGEALARQYLELYDLPSICLRIGSVLKNDNPTNGKRLMKTWLSYRDLRQLIERSTSSRIRFGIYYGVSKNKGRFWDISNARKEIGYLPKDDASLAIKKRYKRTTTNT